MSLGEWKQTESKSIHHVVIWRPAHGNDVRMYRIITCHLCTPRTESEKLWELSVDGELNYRQRVVPLT